LNPAFWRVLGPPTTPAANVDLIRRHLLEKALVVAEHADARRRAFVAGCLAAGRVGEFTPVRSAHEYDPLHARAGKLRAHCRTGQIDPQETFGVEAINGRNGPGSSRSGTSVSREIQALVSVSRFCPSPRSRPPYDVHKRLRGSASISFGVAQRVVTTLRKREVGLAKQPRFDARRSD
jgi:hypothetical protein